MRQVRTRVWVEAEGYQRRVKGKGRGQGGGNRGGGGSRGEGGEGGEAHLAWNICSRL